MEEEVSYSGNSIQEEGYTTGSGRFTGGILISCSASLSVKWGGNLKKFAVSGYIYRDDKTYYVNYRKRSFL